MITFRPGSISLMGELLFCEAVLAWSCPKKKNFWVRLCLSLVVLFTASYFFPFVHGWNFTWESLARILTFLALSYVGLFVCFDIRPFALLTIVASGVGLQHIGYQSYNFFKLLPFGEDYYTFLVSNARLFEILFVAVVGIASFFIFGISFWKNKYYESYKKSLSIISLLTIFICLVLERLIALIPGQERSRSISSVIFDILCVTLALVIEFTIWKIATLNTKNAVLSTLLKNEKKNFEETKQLMTTVNKRGHDLKHLLQDYGETIPAKYLDSVKEEVKLYENRYITDNPNLDVLLSNFNYKYADKGVRIKLVGDTSLIDFMDEMDMVMLFDNTLNNAISAVLKVEESKRTIQVVIEKKGHMVSLLFINYFDGELIMKDGLPISISKTPYFCEHGIGLPSIREIARNYDGDINVHSENQRFYLNIYIFDHKK